MRSASSSSSSSYISKRPGAWEGLKAQLGTTTFFLVNRNGPTVFSLRDEEANTFKITLGSTHTCSCDNTTGYLCLHQLFCLLKVLHVDESHPLSYQTGFTDAETEQVLSGACSSPARRGWASSGGGGRDGPPNLSALARAQRRALQQNSRDGSDASVTAAGTNDFVPRQVLDDTGDDNCPICQDALNRDQALTWCRKGCGNNLHAKCMQAFAQYKIASKQPVSCPLCREDWSIEHLRDDVRGKASLKHSCLPVYCVACAVPVRQGPFYRCLECTDARLSAVREQERQIHQHLLNMSALSVVGSGGPGADAPRTGYRLDDDSSNSAGDKVSRQPSLSRLPPQQRSTAPGGSSSNSRKNSYTYGGENADHLPSAAGVASMEAAATAVAAFKPCDFCPRCYESARLPGQSSASSSDQHRHTHGGSTGHLASHHLLVSEAAASNTAEVKWAACRNPLANRALASRGLMGLGGGGGRVGSSEHEQLRDDLLELEGRVLTDADYDLLLALDRADDADAGSIGSHLSLSLPRWTGRGQSNTCGKALTPLNAAAISAPTASLERASAERCWCEATKATTNNNSGPSETNPLLNPGAQDDVGPRAATAATLRVLPCGHLAHENCIAALLGPWGGDIPQTLRCAHIVHGGKGERNQDGVPTCGAVMFPALRRGRRKKPSLGPAPTPPSTAVNPASAAGGSAGGSGGGGLFGMAGAGAGLAIGLSSGLGGGISGISLSGAFSFSSSKPFSAGMADTARQGTPSGRQALKRPHHADDVSLSLSVTSAATLGGQTTSSASSAQTIVVVANRKGKYGVGALGRGAVAGAYLGSSQVLGVASGAASVPGSTGGLTVASSVSAARLSTFGTTGRSSLIAASAREQQREQATGVAAGNAASLLADAGLAGTGLATRLNSIAINTTNSSVDLSATATTATGASGSVNGRRSHSSDRSPDRSPSPSPGTAAGPSSIRPSPNQDPASTVTLDDAAHRTSAGMEIRGRTPSTPVVLPATASGAGTRTSPLGHSRSRSRSSSPSALSDRAVLGVYRMQQGADQEEAHSSMPGVTVGNRGVGLSIGDGIGGTSERRSREAPASRQQSASGNSGRAGVRLNRETYVNPEGDILIVAARRKSSRGELLPVRVRGELLPGDDVAGLTLATTRSIRNTRADFALLPPPVSQAKGGKSGRIHRGPSLSASSKLAPLPHGQRAAGNGVAATLTRHASPIVRPSPLLPALPGSSSALPLMQDFPPEPVGAINESAPSITSMPSLPQVDDHPSHAVEHLLLPQLEPQYIDLDLDTFAPGLLVDDGNMSDD